MGSSKGSKRITTGYRYLMGVHAIGPHGPVDRIRKFIFGDRVGWEGSVTSNQTIHIDKTNLFGGDKREGGVKGYVDICMGAPDQPANDYLKSKINGPMPAYRGVVGFVFRQFQWSALNPYFKSLAIEMSRWVKGWQDDVVWYPEKARIGEYDMNPAHIIYQVMTNSDDWGNGYPVTMINDTNFRQVADILYNENFGLSFIWSEGGSSVDDVVGMIEEHIDGKVRENVVTGQYEIKLIRDDYTITSLPELNPSNCKVVSFQRSGWGDAPNSISVEYTDRDQNAIVTGAIQNLAAIEAQKRVIPATRSYPAIREGELAIRVGVRDVGNTTTPLAKVTIMANRIAWDWHKADVFKLKWPKLGIEGIAFRIIDINKGELEDGEIEIQAVEDIFSLPKNIYVAPQKPNWTNPVAPPEPVRIFRVVESPYWNVVNAISAADMSFLPEGWAFAEILALRPTGSTFNMELWASPNNSTYSMVQAGGSFSPVGTLSTYIKNDSAQATLTVTNLFDGEQIDEDTYFYIDNEAFEIVTINIGTGVITAKRGILDTIPTEHQPGATVWFSDGGQASDSTTRVLNETVYYKPLPVTGLGTLPLASATAGSIRFAGRAQKPYPPGRFTLNGQFLPEAIDGDVVLAWSHRDRIQQTVGFIDTTVGNIGPEPGTTYSARVLRVDTSAQVGTFASVTGTTGTMVVPYVGLITVELWSMRDTLTSWQRWSRQTERVSTQLLVTNDNLNLITEDGSFLITES